LRAHAKRLGIARAARFLLDARGPIPTRYALPGCLKKRAGRRVTRQAPRPPTLTPGAKGRGLVANIYKIASGVWYAPEWTNSRTGEVVQAHSLGTRDFQVADDTWTLEKARALRPVAASEGHFPRRQLILGPGETFANAVVSYFASKKRWKPATRAAWDEQIDAILDRPFKLPSGRAVTLRGMRIPDFAGDSGTEIVAGWADSEVAR